MSVFDQQAEALNRLYNATDDIQTSLAALAARIAVLEAVPVQPPPVEPPVEEPPVEEPPVEEPPIEEPPVEEPPVEPPTYVGDGIWLSHEKLLALPTEGEAWDDLVKAANAASVSGANVSNQDSSHDTATLVVALVAVRTEDAALRAKAISMLEGAIGTEEGARWLAIGRNLGGYAIATDLLGIHEGPIYEWLVSFLTRTLKHNNSGSPIAARQSAWASGSNASAQEGFAYTAVAALAKDQEALEWSWKGFRKYCGERGNNHPMTDNSDGEWQELPNDPVGIQNKGAVIGGCSADGAQGNDMSRGKGSPCNPGYTQYPWVGIEGSVPAALIFHNLGCPAFEIVDQALLRSANYLWRLRQDSGNEEWFDDSRANECKHVFNVMYGTDFPCEHPVGAGRTVGFTDWTHPKE